MDRLSRSILIVAVAVLIQMALAFWQKSAALAYAKLYEIRTGRRAIYREGSDPHPIVYFFRPELGEPNLLRPQSDAMLEGSRTRYIWRRNVFVGTTLLDWTVMTVLLNANAQ